LIVTQANNSATIPDLRWYGNSTGNPIYGFASIAGATPSIAYKISRITDNGLAYNMIACTGDTVTLNISKFLTADILVVGGGGGAAKALSGGGGGGGLVFRPGLSFAPGTYTLTVGAGGAGGFSLQQQNALGANGGDSTVNGLIAKGGGASGSGYSGTTTDGTSVEIAASAGGCGGGAGGGARTATSGATTNQIGVSAATTSDSYLYGFGNSGGNCGTSSTAGGGGGGAGGAGAASLSATAGLGGPGLYQVTVKGAVYNFKTVFGTSIGQFVGGQCWFAGGGGGGGGSGTVTRSGGPGGGGDGKAAGSGGDAVPFTGGGGGGGGTSFGNGGSGAHGTIILRYLAPASTYVAVYSTKLIVSEYVGPAVRIVDAINRSRDFFADASGVLLDANQQTLGSFIGSGAANVSIFYNQAGGPDFVTNPGNMPAIVYDSNSNRYLLSFTSTSQQMGLNTLDVWSQAIDGSSTLTKSPLLMGNVSIHCMFQASSAPLAGASYKTNSSILYPTAYTDTGLTVNVYTDEAANARIGCAVITPATTGTFTSASPSAPITLVSGAINRVTITRNATTGLVSVYNGTTLGVSATMTSGTVQNTSTLLGHNFPQLKLGTLIIYNSVVDAATLASLSST
jgi:hypothetical protein